MLAMALVAFVSIAATTYPAIQWRIDPSHSNVQFQVKHFFTPVTGTFDSYEATVNFDPNDLGNSNIDVTIQVESVNTNNQRRDGHLKTGDFFEAEKHPSITFKSDEIVSKGDNKYVAKGTLTIKGISKDLELPFTLLGVRQNVPRAGNQVAGITAEAKISRTDFTVGTGNYAANTVIGDEVTIILNLELHASM